MDRLKHYLDKTTGQLTESLYFHWPLCFCTPLQPSITPSALQITNNQEERSCFGGKLEFNYNQTILHTLADESGTLFELASFIPILMQAGYATGALFMCDMMQRRTFVLLLITANVWLGLCLTKPSIVFSILCLFISVMALLVCLARGLHENSWLGWQRGWKLDQRPALAADKADGLSQVAPSNEADDEIELEEIQGQNGGNSLAENLPGHTAQRPKPHPPSTARVLCIWSAIICGVLCPFLDEGIIATAIPQITEDFHSISDIGWYGSSYLMTLCASQIIFGRLYSLFNTNLSSEALIIGRAVAGCGAAGVMSGTIALFAAALPPERLALYVGAMGIVYGLAAVLGPVVGGILTNSSLTWRWQVTCFYINLPFAIPPLLAMFTIIKIPQQDEQRNAHTWWQKMKQLDYLGTVLVFAGITALIMGLQFGGSSYGWEDGRTVGCLVLSAILLLFFSISQWWLGERALVPPRIITLRIVIFGSLFTCFLEGAFLTLAYYLPVWFQSIQGVTAEESGRRYLALSIPFIVAIFSSGWAVSRFGWFQPFMLVGTILVSLSSGLLSTLSASSSPKAWMLYQVLAVVGIGTSTEQASVAVQSLLDETDAPIGLAVVLLSQNLGPAVGISIANAVFTHTLTTGTEQRFPTVDLKRILEAGATSLRQIVDPADVTDLITIYNQAVTRTFLVAAVMGVASITGLVGIGVQRIPSTAV